MVGSRQWLRKADLTVAGTVVDCTELRIQLMVRQADVQHPDWMYARVTNLSDQTAMSMMVENADVQLRAGYEGRYGTIFKGKLAQARKGKEPNGTDKFFDVLATSNQQAYGYATVNKTLQAGAKPRDLAQVAIQAMQQQGGISVGYLTGNLDRGSLPRATSMFGLARDLLRYVSESTDSSWAIQNEQLQIVGNKEYMPGGTIIASPETGMIGQPEQQLKGIVVKMLLTSDARYGQQIHIDQKYIQRAMFSITGPGQGSAAVAIQRAMVAPLSPTGTYKIVRVDHDGDNRGNDWYTTLLCIALDASGNPMTTGTSLDTPPPGGTQGYNETVTERGVPVQDDGSGGGGDTGSGSP